MSFFIRKFRNYQIKRGNKVEEIHCDLEEVRHLIRKQLVQNNFIMLLLFVLFCYLAVKGNPSFFIGMLCVLLWIYVAITLYTLMTGKPIGTKTSKVLQEFHKNHFGGKRWKRKK